VRERDRRDIERLVGLRDRERSGVRERERELAGEIDREGV
jgi:hypothetical protein